MKERKYNIEVEGLMVEITYEYEKGDKGDYFTPPTGDRVTIVSWRLLDGEKIVRNNEYPDYSDEEWEEWMSAIDKYVYKESEWDIIKYERDLDDWL